MNNLCEKDSQLSGDYRWSKEEEGEEEKLSETSCGKRIRVSTLFINDIDLMIFSQLVARLYTQPNSTLLIRLETVGK